MWWTHPEGAEVSRLWCILGRVVEVKSFTCGHDSPCEQYSCANGQQYSSCHKWVSLRGVAALGTYLILALEVCRNLASRIETPAGSLASIPVPYKY